MCYAYRIDRYTSLVSTNNNTRNHELDAPEVSVRPNNYPSPATAWSTLKYKYGGFSRSQSWSSICIYGVRLRDLIGD